MPSSSERDWRAALERIEGRVAKLDAFEEHVRDCTAQSRSVESRLSSLEAKVEMMVRKLSWHIWLPVAGSVLVAVAILVD